MRVQSAQRLTREQVGTAGLTKTRKQIHLKTPYNQRLRHRGGEQVKRRHGEC